MAGESKDSTDIAAMYQLLAQARMDGEGGQARVLRFMAQTEERRAQDLHRIALALETIVALIAKASEDQ